VGDSGEDYLKVENLTCGWGFVYPGCGRTSWVHKSRGLQVNRHNSVKSHTDMFLGEYEHTIDAKGRMAVPARFRGQLEKGAVISKGMGTCLSVYTMQRWEEKSAELVEGKTSEELRDFERRIYPSAGEVELDGQGRLVIPAKLRAYAGLDNEVTVAGVRDHFEIWDRATWQEYQRRIGQEGNGSPF
jgi:MraZ protein